MRQVERLTARAGLVAIGVLGLVLGFQGGAGAVTGKPVTTPAIPHSGPALTGAHVMAVGVGVLALAAFVFLVRIFARRRTG